MARIKQSLSWWCFSKEEPAKFFKQARQIGYAAIELCPRELWDEVRAADLMISAHSVGKLQDSLNRRENHKALEEELGEMLDLASQYNIPNLIVFSGNRRGISDEAGAEITAEGLRRLARPAEARGVNLVLELLNSKVDHIDYQCDHTAWGVKVIESVASPRVKLLYDIYHMQIMEGDLIRTLKGNMPHIGHIHTAGNPGRRDMDETQEINYPPIMRAIADTDYSGYVGHEFMPKGDAIEAIRHAYQLCDV